MARKGAGQAYRKQRLVNGTQMEIWPEWSAAFWLLLAAVEVKVVKHNVRGCLENVIQTPPF